MLIKFLLILGCLTLSGTASGQSEPMAHEGRWTGAVLLVRDGTGTCPAISRFVGAVKHNIFDGSWARGPVFIRIRSHTKRVTDMSISGMVVRATTGTFESFQFETTEGCVYAVMMSKQ